MSDHSPTPLLAPSGGGVPSQVEASSRRIVVITPPSRWPTLRLGDLWENRELLYFLVWRDVKVRYKQTGIGIAWALLQPFLTMMVFTIFFGRLAKVPSDGIQYPVFAMAALIPWQLFAFALTEAGKSVVSSQQLVTKLYFPRLILPVAAALAGLVDFAIAFCLLIGLMAWYHVAPAATVIALPLFILLALATALAVGLWLSALYVKYRDVQYAIPFLTQFWLVLTPIAYSATLVPGKWRLIYGLNPMAGVVEGFRWALLGQQSALSGLVIVSAAAVLALLLGGLFYFRRMERSFADLI